MERWVRGTLLTAALTGMILSNLFIDLGYAQRWLDLAELIFLVVAVFRFSGYSREELGLGGEFSLLKHVLFPLAFFILPLVAVLFVPHRSVSPKIFALYFLNYLLIAGLPEELLFRALLFASFEERFGGITALVGNSVIHWLIHFGVGLNMSQLMAALVLSSYRLTFRRIEPLIIAHALWDAVFIALKPSFVGSWSLVIMAPFAGAFLSILIYLAGRSQQTELSVG